MCIVLKLKLDVLYMCHIMMSHKWSFIFELTYFILQNAGVDIHSICCDLCVLLSMLADISCICIDFTNLALSSILFVFLVIL